MNLDIGDQSLICFDIQVFTEAIKPYKLVQVRDRNINHDDLLHDMYTQFCLSNFSVQ